MGSATLQGHPSVESFFNVAETKTLVLFEHLSFVFLEDFDMFASRIFCPISCLGCTLLR